MPPRATTKQSETERIFAVNFSQPRSTSREDKMRPRIKLKRAALRSTRSASENTRSSRSPTTTMITLGRLLVMTLTCHLVAQDFGCSAQQSAASRYHQFHQQHSPLSILGRSENQLQSSTDNQFQSSASVLADDDEHEIDDGRDRALGGRPPRAAPSIQQQQPFIQAIAGQRLVIPCRNLSSSVGYTQTAEQAGSGQSATNVQGQRRQASSSGGGATVLASSRFKTTQTAATSQTAGGGISLIVWHKDERLNAPIFAADARGAATLRDAKQQASSEALQGGRAHLDLVALGERGTPTPALVIDEASLQDSGLYTCVVEFLRAPTQTFKTRVSVIEPPKMMIIREVEATGGGGENKPLRGDQVSHLMGPYDEDSRLVLVCEAEPGKPTSGQISWWRLDSVTQLGSLLLGGSSARKTSGQSAPPPVTSLDVATHLTTLSIQEDPTTGRFWSDDQATPGLGPRDLFLGPQSLQLTPAPTDLTFGTNQQLPAINHLMSGLNLTSTTARLRHWRRVDNKTAAGSDSTGDTPTSLTAHLELPALSRSMLGAEFLCLAANDLHSLPPLNTSVTLNMNLQPTEVRIVNRSPAPLPVQAGAKNSNNNNQSTFVLGQKTMVECQVVGSKPSPSIKWFRGAQEIEIVPNTAKQAGDRSSSSSTSGAASEFNRDTGNLTKISYLTFVPQLSDNQQALTCSASNTRIPVSAGGDGRGALTDSLVMNVQHEPKLALKLGANIRPDSIKLGSDIFMDCQVEANPPIQELVWLHQGRPLAANISAGVIMSKQSLVLRNLALNQRGAYQCQARNLLGRATSDKLELRPLFEPQCDLTLTRSRYEVALNQPTRIECHVRAEPAEGLHFTWRFNRSSSGSTSSELQAGGAGGTSSNLLDGVGDDATGSDSALSQYETNFTRSSVIFTPRSRRHFGTLLCSAANSMGRQARPCAIQLVQSELPEPVLLCFDDNIRPRSFSIHCTPPATSGSSSALSSSSSGTGIGVGPNKYVLEVYMSPEAAAASQDDAPSSSPGSTHLRLRDQPARSSDADLTSASADYLAGGSDAGGGDLTQADQEEPGRQQQQQQQQVRIKRLLSESPTFDVADLRPNSSYNVLVYVQNSKGRSPAFHHQVSTQPEEEGGGGEIQAAASTHRAGSGGIELGAGGRAARRDDQAGSGAGTNLLAYLKLDDYFGGKSRGTGVGAGPSPLVGVALVVLLASVSLVTLVFFAQRLICGRRVGGRKQHERGCKLSKSSTATTGSDNVDGNHGSKQRRRPPAQDSNEWHSRAAGGGGGCRLAGRGQSGAGSGSDTSRETNTDSTTLVSSPRPTTQAAAAASTDELSSNELNAVHQRATDSNFNCQYSDSGLVVVAAPHQQSSQATASNRRCSYSDLTTLAVENLACQNQSLRAATMMRRPQQHHQQISYDPAAHYQAAMAAGVHQQLRNQAASCTPTQMSVHSSECTSASNNVNADVASLDHVRAGGCGYPPPDGGVYVIQESDSAPPSDLWCDQLAMSMTSDPRNHSHQGGRCQLIEGGGGGDDDDSAPCQFRAQQLPSSFSIPVALSDRLTLIAGGARPGSALQESLRHSQDNLGLQAAANCLINNPNSPYLTLTAGAPLYGDYCPYRQQDELQMPSPPVNFGSSSGKAGGQGGWMATHHHLQHQHQQTDLDSPAPMHQSNCAAMSRAPKHHRVKFDTAASSDFNELDTATSGPSSQHQREPTRL